MTSRTQQAGGPLRDEVAKVVARWAFAQSRALFVGNGYMLREVAAHADADSVFYLFGGMGLAASVAAGYVAASPVAHRRAAVLEGDGNFAMGLAGAIACAAAPGDIVHVVFDNGVYESTGGQAVPWSPRDPVAVARELGYRRALVVADVSSLERALDSPGGETGTSLVWVRGRSGGEPASRPDLDPARCAERFRRWSALRNTAGDA